MALIGKIVVAALVAVIFFYSVISYLIKLPNAGFYTFIAFIAFIAILWVIFKK